MYKFINIKYICIRINMPLYIKFNNIFEIVCSNTVVYIPNILHMHFTRILFYVGGLHLTYHGNGLNISPGLVPTFVPWCNVSLFTRKRDDRLLLQRRIACVNKKRVNSADFFFLYYCTGR